MAASTSYSSAGATALKADERSDRDSGSGYSHPAPSKTRPFVASIIVLYQTVVVVIVILQHQRQGHV